ncbi:hypothetical protein EX30DRAFT_371837 [Ascodesmis nigricans]|uniref:Uncharacterized protein n=1 Tax=Ascodesmis nigricans TaxID=341454 RepID=A0A4S2MVY1_9PEZI|nr:hypothetical protein EX30DRAFT_371837 [Ascodesmis nigricans]
MHDYDMLDELYTFIMPTGLKFEIFYRKILKASTNTNHHWGTYYRVVEHGASISLEGKKWSGTFGGHLQGQDTNEVFGIMSPLNISKRKKGHRGCIVETTELVASGTVIMQPYPADRERFGSNNRQFHKPARAVVNQFGPSSKSKFMANIVNT